jgi:putative membrane protein
MVAFIYTVRPDLPALAGPLHTITGSFLGLLIAFRTNTGYERFWEARKIWESVQNKCRNMARIITSYVINKDDHVLQILQIIATYPYALKQHLR